MAEPLPICHLNGALLPLREARISPLDRSFLFADGVYEVVAMHGGYAARLPANIATPAAEPGGAADPQSARRGALGGAGA